MFRRPPLAALGALALLVAACGTSDGGADVSTPEGSVVPTIGGVGVLPEIGSGGPLVMIGPPLNSDGSEAELLAELVEGNRILLIGDSILAGTSRRYTNNMCNTLVPLGWQVDVEAEASRFVDFGNRVLDRLLPDEVGADGDYDAAVVFLGSNYGSNQDVYEAELREILERLEPRPTLLLTVTEYRRNYSEVNEVVRKLSDEYDHVRLVDWQAVSETPGVLSNDRLHPTNNGRQVLADLIAASLGQVGIGEGECLDSRFTDDSQARSGSGLGGSSSSGSSSSGSSSGGSSSGGSSSGGSSSGGGGVTTTVPATTATTAPSTSTSVSATTTLPTAPSGGAGTGTGEGGAGGSGETGEDDEVGGVDGGGSSSEGGTAGVGAGDGLTG